MSLNTTGQSSYIPQSLTGKGLEAECAMSMVPHIQNKECHFSRYGVNMSVMKDSTAPGGIRYQPQKSLPDFEGIFPGGRQFLFDCKSCSGPNYRVKNDIENNNKQRQLSHLRNRGALGAISGFVIHFNYRGPETGLKTRTEPAGTFWFPCKPNRFWIEFDAGQVTSIGRDLCEHYGTAIEWHIPKGCRRPRPMLFETLLDLMDSD